MLILLPPSEAKTSPQSGSTLDLRTLFAPQLSDARQTVISSLMQLGEGDVAAQVLRLGKRSATQAQTNTRLTTSPCIPAIELYTGVLYDHLSPGTLDQDSRARLEQTTWISSALFGVLRPSDEIPDHRLAMAVALPGIGALAPWWRRHLVTITSQTAGQVVVDCRSGSYRSAMPIPKANRLEITVVRQGSRGRTTVSHMAKKWRGMLVRHLVEDTTLSTHAELDQVLSAIESVGQVSGDQIGIEIGKPRRNRVGGWETLVTIVTSDAGPASR